MLNEIEEREKRRGDTDSFNDSNGVYEGLHTLIIQDDDLVLHYVTQEFDRREAPPLRTREEFVRPAQSSNPDDEDIIPIDITPIGLRGMKSMSSAGQET